MYTNVHLNFVIFFYHRLLSLAKSNLGTIRCCGLTMRGTRWGGSTLRTRNSGEATEGLGCNGALDAATPGRTAGDTRGEATEGTETVGATFAMRWRDGMEGDGGGAAGTAASVATKIFLQKCLLQGKLHPKLWKNLLKIHGFPWILFLPATLEFRVFLQTSKAMLHSWHLPVLPRRSLRPNWQLHWSWVWAGAWLTRRGTEAIEWKSPF